MLNGINKFIEIILKLLMAVLLIVVILFSGAMFKSCSYLNDGYESPRSANTK